MSEYWISLCILAICIYIAHIVSSIFKNQTMLNDARYEQIKKLQNEVEKLKAEIRSIKE